MRSHPRDVPVSPADLEAHLASDGGGDPAAGIFSPDSVSWRFNRELANFLAGGRAALMQLAHPPVAQAIADHSIVRDDVRQRFERTFRRVFAMSFGDRDSAREAARGVHAVHQKIVGRIAEDGGDYRAGDRYVANRPRSLFWVHATLLDSVGVVRQRLFGPDPADELAAYYEESKQFAVLFGLAGQALPADAGAFSTYMDETLASGFVAVGTLAREIASALFRPPHPMLAPAYAAYRALTGWLLPDNLRAAYRFPAPPRSAPLALRALGATVRRLPPAVRYVPAYWEALARVGRPVPVGTLPASRRIAAWLGLASR